MAALGNIGLWPTTHRRRPTDYRVSASGKTWLGIADARLWKQIASPEHAERRFYYPCVIGDRRGMLYWKQGSNALFRIAEENERPKAETGWRWIRPGIARFRWAVSAGENTFSLSLIQSGDHTPRPALRVLANDALGIAETVAAAGPETGTAQTLAIAINATAAGVITLQLEWWAMTEREEVIWEKMIVS